jgi:hypothetical protein
MHCVKRLSFALVFCLAASIPSWGQSAQVVYVTTGNSQVFAVTTSGVVTPLLPAGSYSGSTFNSLTVGPDNTGDNAAVDANGNYNFFLYACDNANDNIIRIELNTAAPSTAPPAGNIATVTTNIPQPVCGRVGSNVEVTSVSQINYATTTTSGNLYVSSGFDIYQIADASSTPNTGTFNVSLEPIITSTASSLGGITQKNSGDLLVVNPSGSGVLRAQFTGGASSFSSNVTSYITDTTDLTNPVGIARTQAPEKGNAKAIINDFFVVNNGQGKQGAVYGFDPTYSLKTPFCSYGFSQGNVNPTSIAASEDNFLYVGVNSNSASKWGIQLLTPGCQSFQSSFISLTALSSQKLSSTGPSAVAVPPVAVPPSSTNSSVDPSSNAKVTNYNFGSSLLQLALGTCKVSGLVQTPMPLSVLQNLVNGAQVAPYVTTGQTWLGGAPALGNGESGFATVYSFDPSPANCSPADVQTNILIGAFLDPSVANPRIVHCEDNFTDCEVLGASGTWPTGGYLPNDNTIGGKVPGFGSKYFLVNGNITTTDHGYFCGFGSPLIDASSPSDPMAVFNSGQGVSVKFKLGADPSCSNGNFVTDASALLSIAQIKDGKGNDVFQPIQINTQGSSTDTPPIFKFNSNSQNYQFSLNLSGYAPGIYALTVTFLSNNAPAAITYFQVQ